MPVHAERSHEGFVQGLDDLAVVDDGVSRVRSSGITGSQHLLVQWWYFKELQVQSLWNAEGRILFDQSSMRFWCLEGIEQLLENMVVQGQGH